MMVNSDVLLNQRGKDTSGIHEYSGPLGIRTGIIKVKYQHRETCISQIKVSKISCGYVGENISFSTARIPVILWLDITTGRLTLIQEYIR
jgi:hypothetical protein